MLSDIDNINLNDVKVKIYLKKRGVFIELVVVNKSVTTLFDNQIIIDSKICYFDTMLKQTLLFFFILSVFNSSAQIVDEKIQIDSLTEIVKVIYKPTINTTYYFKEVAVFADDTSQVAVEKSYTSYGQNGLYKAYYKTGRLKIKTVFANDKINGEWTYYDLNGIIITKGIYKAGVKHGYWAYKSLNIFGRYRRGVKNRKWKRFDANGKKHLSHYKNGILTGGEGYDGDEKIEGVLPRRNIFAKIFPKKRKKTDTIIESKIPEVTPEVAVKSTPEVIEELPEVVTEEITKEYKQAISFLKTNALFKRKIKEFSKGSIKKYFKSNVFQFEILPQMKSLSMASFIKEADDDKIAVAVIDLLLNNESENLKNHFNGNNVIENSDLQGYSTDKASLVKVTFSDIKYNLLRIDVDWKRKEEKLQFKVLLYFDNNGVLKGAEYQKPQ